MFTMYVQGSSYADEIILNGRKIIWCTPSYSSALTLNTKYALCSHDQGWVVVSSLRWIHIKNVYECLWWRYALSANFARSRPQLKECLWSFKYIHSPTRVAEMRVE